MPTETRQQKQRERQQEQRERQQEQRERELVLENDLKFADENLNFYTRRLKNIHENPDVNSSYLKDEPWIWNFNQKVVEYWIGIKAGLEKGLTIEEQEEIKRNEELNKSKDGRCIVSGGRRYKRTIKRRKLTKRRNLKSRKVK